MNDLTHAKDFSQVEDIKDYNNPVIEVGVLNFDYLIGKVFQHTELLGLTDRQLTAYKATLRHMFWSWFNSNLPNPSGLSDPSKQGRQHNGIEATSTPTPIYSNSI